MYTDLIRRRIGKLVIHMLEIEGRGKPGKILVFISERIANFNQLYSV
jgi:hypothetical protein